MSTNPHYAKALDLAESHTQRDLQIALIEATLAAAFEQARTADELHTANLLASLQPVHSDEGVEIHNNLDRAQTIIETIDARLGLEGAF